MSAAFTREDMVDAIATTISDSLDVDWNSRIGAEAVVRNCGVFELYGALEAIMAHHAGFFVSSFELELADQARAALAKARGDA